MDALPIIDIGDFETGGFERCADEIARACRTIGFFYLVNHSVPRELMDATFAQSRTFFALPYAKKAEIEMRKVGGNRGYSVCGSSRDFIGTRAVFDGFPFQHGAPDHPATNSSYEKASRTLQRKRAFVSSSCPMPSGGTSRRRSMKWPPLLPSPSTPSPNTAATFDQSS